MTEDQQQPKASSGWLPRPTSLEPPANPVQPTRNDSWLRAPIMDEDEQEIARRLQQYQRDLAWIIHRV